MKTSFATVLVSLLLPVATVDAQISYRDSPGPTWLSSVPPLGTGNTVQMAPGGSMVVITSQDATVSALDPANGDLMWSYKPDNVQGNPLSSSSGVVFSSTALIGDYIAYAVTDGVAQADPSSCRVIALDLSGQLIWESPSLEGACSGTPTVSGNGQWIFLTHNLVAVGHFTILMANNNGTAFYQNLDLVQPYAPPGIFHSPAVGYYDGGSLNRNDILVWSYRPMPSEAGVGNGKTFGFQFPTGFTGINAAGLGVITLNNVTWQSISPPKITNFGYNMYYTVSRSQFRAWTGSPGNRPNQFDRLATFNRGYARGDPVWQAVFSSVALSSDTAQPMVFGGTAGNLFVALRSDLSEMWNITTTTTIMAEAVVSPDDVMVYFIESRGVAHAINVETGVELWSQSVGNAPVMSNFAQSSDGGFLYFGDVAGNVICWKVADPPTLGPTTSPSDFPTVMPTASPTLAPIVGTFGPTLSPSAMPSPVPSASSSESPSELPSSAPSRHPSPTPPTTAGPTPRPTPAPTPEVTQFQGGTPAPTPAPTESGASCTATLLSLVALVAGLVLLV